MIEKSNVLAYQAGEFGVTIMSAKASANYCVYALVVNFQAPYYEQCQ